MFQRTQTDSSFNQEGKYLKKKKKKRIQVISRASSHGDVMAVCKPSCPALHYHHKPVPFTHPVNLSFQPPCELLFEHGDSKQVNPNVNCNAPSYTHTHTHTHTHKRTYVRTHTHTHTNARTHVCVHTHTSYISDSR